MIEDITAILPVKLALICLASEQEGLDRSEEHQPLGQTQLEREAIESGDTEVNPLEEAYRPTALQAVTDCSWEAPHQDEPPDAEADIRGKIFSRINAYYAVLRKHIEMNS